MKKIFEARDRIRTSNGKLGIVVNSTTAILIEKSSSEPSGFKKDYLDINEKSQTKNLFIDLMSEADIRELEKHEPQLVFILDMMAQTIVEFAKNE